MSVRDAAEVVVRDNEAERYEIFVGSRRAGFAEYHAQPGLITATHTEIDRPFEGRGLGSRLIREMLDDFRRREAKVLPICPFVRAVLRALARPPRDFSDYVRTTAATGIWHPLVAQSNAT